MSLSEVDLAELDPAQARGLLAEIEADCAGRGENFDTLYNRGREEYCRRPPAERTTPECEFFIRATTLIGIMNRAHDHPPEVVIVPVEEVDDSQPTLF